MKAGKIRHFGLSNESAWGTMTFLKHAEARSLPRVESVQNAYNLLNRTYEVALAEVSMREHVSLLAYSPLAQGYLTGKYLDGARPAGARTTLFDRGQRYENPVAEQADPQIRGARAVNSASIRPRWRSPSSIRGPSSPPPSSAPPRWSS